jgi:hypothetical protein
MSPADAPEPTPHGGIYILVNGKRVGPFEHDEVTGLEIKTKGGYAPTTDLFRKSPTGLVPVRNDERVRIHEGEQFEDFEPTPVS